MFGDFFSYASDILWLTELNLSNIFGMHKIRFERYEPKTKKILLMSSIQMWQNDW